MGVYMLRTMLIAALFAATPAAFAASAVARSPSGDSVMLTQESCPAAIADRVLPEVKPQLRRAYTVINGKQYAACWAITGPVVHLVYEDGDEGLVPVVDFKEQPDI